MPLFGSSAAKRYQSLGPIALFEFCDPTTVMTISLAKAAVIDYCDRVVGFPADKGPVWQREMERLVTDGYVLGRVEEGTEKDHLRFSTAHLEVAEPERMFRVLCLGAVKQATSGDPFAATAPRDGQISQLLLGFCDEAVRCVLEAIDDEDAEEVDWRRFGALANAAIHLGREIALMEGYFLNPKKRSQLKIVIQRLGEAASERDPS